MKKNGPICYCPHCHQKLSEKWIKQQYKRFLGQGRPKTLRPCGFCGRIFGYREMRTHVPQCRKNPRRRGPKS